MPPVPNYSVYRGQAKTGRGEGPNKPIAHGEQYLAGSADELYDEDLLQAIRPWLTLDSESADHNRLGDQLEAWSYFAERDWLFVARLVSAGIYDRRAAYFSHARAWPLKECRQTQFDPAVYFGCSKVFDPPPQENHAVGVSDSLLPQYPAQAMPQRWNAQLQAEAAVAVQFLGHLLQALDKDYPLLIQAPLEAFAAGSALSALVAFAHAALPYGLKQGCAIRFYTRHPERFVRHLRTQLIVLPEDSARDAFAASQRNATLLDHSGQLIAGTALEPVFEAYAKVATRGALGAPQALLPFGAYLGRGDRSLLWRSGNEPWLQLAYLITMALAGDDEAYRIGMLRHQIIPQATLGLPWETLLSGAEWLAFPQAELAAFILGPADTPGVQALQDAAARALLVELLKNPGQWPAWGAGLLDYLQARPGLANPDTKAAIEGFGKTLDVFKDWDAYVRFAELLPPADPQTGDFSGNPLAVRLWDEVTQTGDLASLRKLLDLALSPQSRCLNPLSLLAADGQLPPRWRGEAEIAGCLLDDAVLLERLDMVSLLESFYCASPRLGDETVLKVYDRLTWHWMAQGQAATDAMVEVGAWYGWRRSAEARLSLEQRRQAAFEWLRSPRPERKPASEATLEAWKQVAKDLEASGGLSGEDIAGLARRWPWIPPFEDIQIEDIARLATDLAVLAGFAESANAVECDSYLECLFKHYQKHHGKTLPKGFVCGHLRWILQPLPPELWSMGLESSLYLYQNAGQRRPLALKARCDAVLGMLGHDPIAALDAADDPNLWLEQTFVQALVRWLCRADIDTAVLRDIDDYFARHPKTLPTIPSDTRRQAARILRGKGFLHIAKCLSPLFENASPAAAITSAKAPQSGFVKPVIRHEEMPDDISSRILESLSENRYEPSFWMAFSANDGYSSNKHPVIRAADFNDLFNVLPPQARQNLSGIIAHDRQLLAHMSSPGPTDLGPRLPLFELYSSIGKKDELAYSARDFLRLVNDNNKTLLENRQWWIALINSIQKRCHAFPDNSLAGIVTSIRATVKNLANTPNAFQPPLNSTIAHIAEEALVVAGLAQKTKPQPR